MVKDTQSELRLKLVLRLWQNLPNSFVKKQNWYKLRFSQKFTSRIPQCHLHAMKKQLELVFPDKDESIKLFLHLLRLQLIFSFTFYLRINYQHL